MKRILTAGILVMFLISLTGCGQGEKAESSAAPSAAESAAASSRYLSSLPDWYDASRPEQEVLADMDRALIEYRELIESLDAEKITRIEMETFEGVDLKEYKGGRGKVYQTTDKAQIARWVDLFQSMELTARPAGIPGGGATHMYTVYQDNTEISLKSFATSTILGSWGDVANFEIKNYDDLEEEFDSLEREMGYTRPE